MSLICWVPLTSNILNNQGIENMSVTNNGATYSSSGGKLGAGCWSFSDGTKNGHGINIYKNFTDIGSNRSICAWVYPKGNHANYTGAVVSSGNWNSSRWSFGLKRDNTGFTGFDSGYSSYYSTSIPLNTWTHLCVTVADGVTKFYKNGIYLGEQSRGSGTVNSDAPNTMIGRETYSGGYFGFNGSIQDVRIYNHTLTPQEVKEISKGLVAHYTLGSASLGSNGNLINGLAVGRQCTVSGNSINISGTDSDTYFYIKTTKAMTSGKLYRLSCIGSGFPETAVYNFPIAGQFNTGPGYINIKNGPRVLTFVANDACANAGTNIIMDDIGRIAGAGTISGLCLEEINSISDSSGYSRNLTIAGNVSPADSVRYDKGIYMPNQNINSNYLTSGSNWSPSFITTGSISFWCKFNGLGSNGWLPFTGQNGYYYLMATSHGAGNFYHGEAGSSTTIYRDGVVVSAPSDNENWHHYVITGINLSTWTTFKINQYGDTWNSNMYVSDLRLYNTILSADDVKDLYSLGATIS